MFKIKTFLDKSPIHGTGLFAKENIKKGDVIYIINENLNLILTEKEFKKLKKDEQKFICHYGYKSKDKYYLSFDNIRFCNHSNEKNNITKSVGKKSVVLKATRNIKKGEELLQNYSEFEKLRPALKK